MFVLRNRNRFLHFESMYISNLEYLFGDMNLKLEDELF